MSAFVSMTRTRRIASCFGDGAAAIPRDPTHLGFVNAGANAVYLDPRTGEIYMLRGPMCGIAVLGFACVAVLAPVSPAVPSPVGCADAPPREPWVRPPLGPRPSPLLKPARDLGRAVHAAEPDLTVEPEAFEDLNTLGGGELVRMRVSHRAGASATFVIRRSWGELWIEDVDRTMPSTVFAVLQQAFARIREVE